MEHITTVCEHCGEDVIVTTEVAAQAMSKARKPQDPEEMARRGRLGAAKRWGNKPNNA